MYLEAGTTVYTALGSDLTATTNYVTGLMNVISLVFDNEQLAVVLSRLQVNSTNDNIPVTGSDVVLNAFSARMGTTTTFTEPIGHYLTANRGLGGLAYVGILCSSRSFRTGMSDIDETYSQLPTYSWSVNVMSHELGHNLGSRHTQWCGWQISPTIRRQIDSCYNSETAPGGTCYTGPNIGRVGTIMSYCHLTGSVNLALGFGPLPGATIRSEVSNSFCLATSNITPPTITASGSVSLCSGDSVTLTATGGLKYIWSNGATTSSIIVKTAGRYSVNALLGTCRSPESNLIEVLVIAAPTVPTVTANRSTNLCSGETVRLTSSIATGNQWFKDGSIISGATSNTLTVTTAGNYQVRQGPNANNCFSMSTPTRVNIGFIDRTNSATTSVNNVCSGTSVQLRSNRTLGLNSTFSNTNPVTISETGTPTVQSVITIPTSYVITNQDTIVIAVNLLHTYLGDLNVNLISPTGTRITLFNRQGSNNDNLTNTRFSNFLGSSLSTGTAPYNGIFTPTNSLATYVNQNISGNWTLEIVDNAN
ncbi:MAG: M12 family metallo-peptidase, partial [Flexibacteraceae bacterium]